MPTSIVTSLLAAVDHSLVVNPDGEVQVNSEPALRAKVHLLAEKSAVGQEAERGAARWLIWEAASRLGIFPASIHDLYMARGRGETPVNFTVPAMNLRTITFDCARAVFRAAAAVDAKAMVFEISRGEMGYTNQRPAEYSAGVLAAAIREGHRGPVFLQADHCQVSAKNYAADPGAEVQAVKDLIAEALAGGFFNIDIDTSTLVDLRRATIRDQQAGNTRRCAEITAHVRALEPDGLTVSVGAELGEIGGGNSTEVELRAFMDGYAEALPDGRVGVSKISIDTGTAHGGVVLPDGRLAEVAVDFDVLKRLSLVGRREYGLAGAVQHGASTLPDNAFARFPECEACEVHLAADFMNSMFDHLPSGLRDEMYEWLRVSRADDRSPGDTDEQFYYRARRQALGPFKARLWGLPEEKRNEIASVWEKRFGFLFEQLNIGGTRALVEKHVWPIPIRKTLDDFGVVEATVEEVKGLAD